MSSLLLLPVAWVPVPFGFRWSLPADSRSYEGLGGGIAWALDPAFCEQLLPSFHEDAPTSRYYRFVDCDEIKDAFVRAMSTWAANHDFLNFKDVSSECAALGVGRACGLAELYIQATASSNGTAAAANLEGGGALAAHESLGKVTAEARRLRHLRQDVRALAASILHEPRAAHPVPALHAVDGATDESTAACTAHEVLFTAKHDRADAHALAPRRSLRHPAAVSAEPLAC